MNEILLKAHEISKSFGGIQALDNVSFEVRKGEVLSLIGENGAGKSTLAKIISGIIGRDSGGITFQGSDVHFRNIREAVHAGISIVLQEFSFVPHLSIAENIFLTDEGTYHGGIWLNRRKIYKSTRDLFDKVDINLNLDPARKVDTLSVAEQQLVEVAKAVSVSSCLLILDEPTATLTSQETAKLFTLLQKLKSEGVTIIFVSHRLEEIMEISDRIIVLRDGKKVREFEKNSTTAGELINAMVGRDIGSLFSIRQRNAPGERVVHVENLSREGKVFNCSFSVHKGEIVGLSGLVGAGRTELVRLLFGADRPDSGKINIMGKTAEFKTPLQAVRAGVAMVPEDRKKHGVLISLSVNQNITLSYYTREGHFWISRSGEDSLVDRMIRDLKIKTDIASAAVSSLSGGNQQKVVIAKWLVNNPEVLILDEPTRGIDVGAKFEIYNLINELAAKGVAIILVSSELPEILALSDRILVMKEGRIVKELGHNEATEEKILTYCAQGANNDV